MGEWLHAATTSLLMPHTSTHIASHQAPRFIAHLSTLALAPVKRQREEEKKADTSTQKGPMKDLIGLNLVLDRILESLDGKSSLGILDGFYGLAVSAGEHIEARRDQRVLKLVVLVEIQKQHYLNATEAVSVWWRVAG